MNERWVRRTRGGARGARPTPRLARWSLGLALLITLPSVAQAAPVAARLDRGPQTHAGVADIRPNIVLILTDDQRWDTLSVMPTIQAQLVSKGVSFSNAFATTPLCCPSRASILTGSYAHATGVYTNVPPDGGFARFDDASTIATWLHQTGYETALIGKYLNGYVPDDTLYIPPGWDDWAAYEGGYYNYSLNVDGVRESHGTGDADYSTDVLRDKAVGIIEGTPAQVPLFLYFAPFAPHGTQLAPDDLLYHGPPRPARRHAGMFSGLANYRPPSFDEANVSDKPAYIRDLPRFTAEQISQIDAFRRGQYESLQAVDEATAAIIDALSAQGRLANTVVIFMSDQGVTWGEHRWQTTKLVPYEESIRLPLVIRYDQMTTVRSEGSLVANIDIAPTIADLADVTPATPVEGASLVPFLLGVAPPTWRKNMALEWSEFGDVPGYCGLRGIDGRGRPYMYARYQTGEEELYNLKADPYELMNSAAGSPLLPQLRVKNESLCDPPPPGYTFP